MSMLEVVPDDIRVPGRIMDFLDWLVGFSVPKKVKKELLVDYCKEYDIDLERWMVEYIGAQDY